MLGNGEKIAEPGENSDFLVGLTNAVFGIHECIYIYILNYLFMLGIHTCMCI